MSDRFDIQRKLENAGDEIVSRTHLNLEKKGELERERRARLIKLGTGYFFDPVEKALLKKEGSQYGFVRHDRRHQRTARASQAEAEARGFRLVAGGLFWDEKAKRLYRKSGGHYLLYTGDRRKAPAKNVGIRDRRKSRG
jgi:hypothetical protein